MKENLKVRSIIEIVGSPENYINEIMDKVVNKLDERAEIKVLKKDVFKANQIEGKPLWSSFCEVELDIDGVDTLLSYCLDFMPSSIEIVEPDIFSLKNNKVTNMFNDLLAKLHENNIILKNTQAENIILKRQLEKDKKK